MGDAADATGTINRAHKAIRSAGNDCSLGGRIGEDGQLVLSEVDELFQK
jgi:hypothetical protein